MEVLAYVSDALLESGDHFRHGFLRGLVLSLLAHADRFPLHAGAVSDQDAALLLLAPAGTGKSTLAYAWLRSGGRLLSDDVVYVQREGARAVWGAPGHVHLLADTATHFPELAREQPVRLATGKTKIPLSVTHPGDEPPRFVYERFGICLLRRDSGAAASRLRAIRATDIPDELTRAPEERFDAMAGEAASVLAGLAPRGAWVLELGGSPTSAVPLLREMLQALEP
jgi:hypothetical protein